MKYFREFEVPLAGLGLGKHTYNFVIGPTFFARLDYASFEEGDVKVKLLIDKRENLSELKFEIEGHIVVPCARCLDPLKQPIKGVNQLIVKYGEHYLEESDEVLVLPLGQHYFDLSHLIYEYISLLVPFKCVHSEVDDEENKCNPSMINRLEQHKTVSQVDPRWDTLKKLKNRNE